MKNKYIISVARTVTIKTLKRIYDADVQKSVRGEDG